jgi:DNA-binding CsgD family transcriptional regulator/PAS domain-containing protein
MLVEQIYACATDPALWPATLGKINDATACAHAALGLVSFPEHRSLLRATTGFDDDFYARFNANMGQFEELWGGAEAIATFPVNEPVVLSRHRPGALVRGERGHDLLCRVLGFDVADTLNLPLVHVGQAVGTAAFARSVDAGRFDARDSSFFRMLSPHMRRSTEINGLLEASTLNLSALDSLFDRLNAPVLIADRTGRLVHVNRAAESLLSGGLISTTADAKSIRGAALVRAIASIASESGTTPHELVIERSPVDSSTWTFHVIGLGEGEKSVRPQFVAVIGAPVAHPTTQWLDAIGRNCGLTATETGVLGHLLQGYSTDQVAAVLGVETSTVRTHLLHIYDKLDVHGRAELIVKVHAMVPPFIADEQALH